MAKHGWIKIYRKITDSLVWSDPALLKMWILCLTKASHESNTFNFNGQKVRLNSGQYVTGRTAISVEYNYGSQKRHQISAVSAWRMLKKLETMQMLNIKTTTKYSIVTVLNWDSYQETEQQPDIKPTTTRHQTDTNKNDKNDKNYKNISSSATLSDVYSYWQANGFGGLNGMTGENLQKWAADLQKNGSTQQQAHELLIKAMGVASENNAKNYRYVNAILENWEKRQLKTVGEVDAYEQQRAAQRKKRQAPARNNEEDESYGGVDF